MTNYKSLSVIALGLLLLAGCGSSGGLGDILGGGGSNTTTAEIRGTVDSVDLNSRSIYLTNVSGLNSMLSSGGGSTARVYFDDQTAVEYQGRTYSPQDLDRGDQVSIRVEQSSNRLLADRVTVLSDVNTSGTSGTTLRGTVGVVDQNRRTIQIDRGYGSTVTVEYDMNTPVNYNNRSYTVSDLERGDEIEVRGRDLGNGRWLAQDINVTRSVSGTGPGSTTSNYSTIRGTVRNVDTTRRTIELEQASYVSGFDRGAGNTIVVQYDTNTAVEVQGQQQPVTGLERGDVVEVEVQNLGGSNLLARKIHLVKDVRSF